MTVLADVRTDQRPRIDCPVPVDERLPAVALLDRATLTTALQSSAPGARVTDARVAYLDYVPGTALVVHALAQVDGSPAAAVVRAGTAVTPRSRVTGTALPGLDAVVHWLPEDPDLPLLAALPDDLLCAVPALADLVPPSVGHRPTVLSYVPGRRATVALPYVVKTYASEDEFTSARAALTVLGDAAHLPTPRSVTTVPSHRATVQHLVTGTPAAWAQALALAPLAAELLIRLHASRRTAATTRGTAEQLRDARISAAVLDAARPDLGARAGALLDTLEAAAPRDLPLVLSHGDFTTDQLLLAADGRLVVTDVDNACQAPAALDLATFAANLVSGRDGDDARAEAVLRALVRTYGAPPGLSWHVAVALVRRCDRPFRRMKKRWPQKSAAILALAEKVSTSCA